MVGGTDAQNLLPPALAGYGRSVACVRESGFLPSTAEKIPWRWCRKGWCIFARKMSGMPGASWRFFRPGDWMDTSMLLPLRHGVCYFTTKYAGRLTVFFQKRPSRAAAVQPQAMDIWNGALDGLAQAWLRHSYILQQRTPPATAAGLFPLGGRTPGRRKGHPSAFAANGSGRLSGGGSSSHGPGADKDESREGLLSGARRTWTLLET